MELGELSEPWFQTKERYHCASNCELKLNGSKSENETTPRKCPRWTKEKQKKVMDAPARLRVSCLVMLYVSFYKVFVTA